ncbi:hypothetical protein D3C85_1929960 [compost metagenome]
MLEQVGRHFGALEGIIDPNRPHILEQDSAELLHRRGVDLQCLLEKLNTQKFIDPEGRLPKRN